MENLIVENAAYKIAGVTRVTLRRHREIGNIKAVRFAGRFWCYEMKDLIDFKNSRNTGARAR